MSANSYLIFIPLAGKIFLAWTGQRKNLSRQIKMAPHARQIRMACVLYLINCCPVLLDSPACLQTIATLPHQSTREKAHHSHPLSQCGFTFTPFTAETWSPRSSPPVVHPSSSEYQVSLLHQTSG